MILKVKCWKNALRERIYWNGNKRIDLKMDSVLSYIFFIIIENALRKMMNDLKQYIYFILFWYKAHFIFIWKCIENIFVT